MKRFMVVMVAVLFASIPLTGAVGNLAAESVSDGVFVHISHGKDNPHRLLMALNMANIDVGLLIIADQKKILESVCHTR